MQHRTLLFLYTRPRKCNYGSDESPPGRPKQNTTKHRRIRFQRFAMRRMGGVTFLLLFFKIVFLIRGRTMEMNARIHTRWKKIQYVLFPNNFSNPKIIVSMSSHTHTHTTPQKTATFLFPFRYVYQQISLSMYRHLP